MTTEKKKTLTVTETETETETEHIYLSAYIFLYVRKKKEFWLLKLDGHPTRETTFRTCKTFATSVSVCVIFYMSERKSERGTVKKGRKQTVQRHGTKNQEIKSMIIVFSS